MKKEVIVSWDIIDLPFSRANLEAAKLMMREAGIGATLSIENVSYEELERIDRAILFAFKNGEF